MSEHPLILQLDVGGNPLRWINYEQAVYYYAKGLVAWSVGADGMTIWGGKSRLTGDRSFMDLNTIIAVHGDMKGSFLERVPVLTNRGLFRRDHNMCAYCGNLFKYEDLTCDHVTPRSRGGRDRWENVVTACGGCNKLKDDRTPEEAHMKLLYLPYAPNKAEHLILMNRNILADQMDFLLKQVKPVSRLLPQNAPQSRH